MELRQSKQERRVIAPAAPGKAMYYFENIHLGLCSLIACSQLEVSYLFQQTCKCPSLIAIAQLR